LEEKQTGHKFKRIIRRAGIPEIKDSGENKVQYDEHQKRLQYDPDIA